MKLSLLATSSVPCGPTVLAGYRSAALNALSASLNSGNQLCGASCILAFNNAITCDGTNQVKIDIDFGYLKWVAFDMQLYFFITIILPKENFKKVVCKSHFVGLLASCFVCILSL